jgi:hypothetical protein
LTRNVSRHLGRQFEASSYLILRFIAQASLVTHLAMLKALLAYIIQGITLRQWRGSPGLKLFRRRMQFELSRDDLFHRTSVSYFRGIVNDRNM